MLGIILMDFQAKFEFFQQTRSRQERVTFNFDVIGSFTI